MVNRLKVLFIPGWYPTKENPTFGIFIREYAKAISLYNDIVILHLEVNQKPRNHFKLISDEKEEGIRTVRVQYSSYWTYSSIGKIAYLKYTLSIIRAFNKFIKKTFKPDIIHTNVFFTGVAGLIISRYLKVSLVITEHYSAFPRHILSKFNIKIARFGMNRAQIILPVSKFLWKNIRNYGIDNKFEVVPNVVNVDLFFPESNREFNSAKKILLVANLVPRKGISLLLLALNQLHRRREDFTLDIIGGGRYMPNYKKLSMNLELEDKVKFWGTKIKSEVAEFMKKCSFLVLPSFVETFGCVLIEALACGKPVVVTDSGGPKEFINKNLGILVPSNDAKALREGINYMLDHFQDYSPEYLSQYVREHYSYKVVGKRLNTIYRRLTSKI